MPLVVIETNSWPLHWCITLRQIQQHQRDNMRAFEHWHNPSGYLARLWSAFLEEVSICFLFFITGSWTLIDTCSMMSWFNKPYPRDAGFVLNCSLTWIDLVVPSKVGCFLSPVFMISSKYFLFYSNCLIKHLDYWSKGRSSKVFLYIWQIHGNTCMKILTATFPGKYCFMHLHALTGLFKFQPPPESIAPVGYLQESLYHQLNSESANPRNGSFHNAHNWSEVIQGKNK